MNIAIVQREDVDDMTSHSGTYRFMATSLREHVGTVRNLGPDHSVITAAVERFGQMFNRATYSLLGRRLVTDHNSILSGRLGSVYSSRVAESCCDIIFAPNASLEIASLETDIPIVYRTDQNWHDIISHHPGYSMLSQSAIEMGERVERAAITKASALLYPSAWAAKTAIEHYGADPRKVHVVPSGANFDNCDIPPRKEALKHSCDRVISLLWVGADWERKGGAIAYDCLMELLNSGVEARLVVCGCVPPKRYRHLKIDVIPFLSKNDPAQRKKLSGLYLGANFFLFPTSAEAYGIVVCEASAHGVPSLARNTGGVAGALTDGENGYLLPADAKGKEYAEKILKIVRYPAVYKNLVWSSRKAYEERLNWDAWGRAVRPIFEQLALVGGGRPNEKFDGNPLEGIR